MRERGEGERERRGENGAQREREGERKIRRRRNKYNGLKDQSNAQSFVNYHMGSS